MRDPVVVQLSPDKPNIYLCCEEFNSIWETFGPLADLLSKERTNLGRVIIFCKKVVLCSQLYSFFLFKLRDNFTEPPGCVDKIECRLVDMFTSGTHCEVKDVILKSFKSRNALRIVIATIAFGLGIDCPDVRQVINFGTPNNIEDYLQQIGRAGRDSQPCTAKLLYGKHLMKNSSKSIIEYCTRSTACRRSLLFSEFDSYTPHSLLPLQLL